MLITTSVVQLVLNKSRVLPEAALWKEKEYSTTSFNSFVTWHVAMNNWYPCTKLLILLKTIVDLMYLAAIGCHRGEEFIASSVYVKSKGILQQAEVALGVPGRLRPRIFSTFGTTRVVGHQPNAPVAFTPGKIPGTHFQRLSWPQCTWFCQKEPRIKSQVTPPGIDPGTVWLVVQRLNHYATPGPDPLFMYMDKMVCGLVLWSLRSLGLFLNH